MTRPSLCLEALSSRNEIWPGLWQGAAPEPGAAVRLVGFDMLVLCAASYQPDGSCFPGVEVVHCPFDDEDRPVSLALLRRIEGAAKQVVRAVQSGQQVLVTCQAGLNRSGFVTAVALTRLMGVSGLVAVRRVQSRRDEALFNKSFVQAIVRNYP